MPSLLALPTDHGREKLARIAQPLCVFAHLVSCVVVDGRKPLPLAPNPSPKTRERIREQGGVPGDANDERRIYIHISDHVLEAMDGFLARAKICRPSPCQSS